MEWILTHVIEMLALIGTFLAAICWVSVKIGAHVRDLNNLITQTIPGILNRIIRLEGYFDNEINNKMKQRNSPISLTPYAKEVLKDIEFNKIFDLMKNDLCKRLDEYKLHTKYDVQEMSDFLMRKIREDKLCDPLKQAAFAKGYSLDEILSAASIPLRDYYLSIHSEIKN
jgi:hypothetical protein